VLPTYTGGDGQELKGAGAGFAVAEMYLTAFRDLRFEVRQQWSPEPDVAIMELTAWGTHQAELDGIPATGRAIEVVACNIVEVADGRIVRERESFDVASIRGSSG
jgi:predicted ester cyclase